MKPIGEETTSQTLPQYMADLAGKATGTRASKRAAHAEEKRSRTTVHWNVNVMLPRQRALQQPDARLDAEARMVRSADLSME